MRAVQYLFSILIYAFEDVFTITSLFALCLLIYTELLNHYVDLVWRSYSNWAFQVNLIICHGHILTDGQFQLNFWPNFACSQQ